jgi:hypothetical protein
VPPRSSASCPRCGPSYSGTVPTSSRLEICTGTPGRRYACTIRCSPGHSLCGQNVVKGAEKGTRAAIRARKRLYLVVKNYSESPHGFSGPNPTPACTRLRFLGSKSLYIDTSRHLKCASSTPVLTAANANTNSPSFGCCCFYCAFRSQSTTCRCQSTVASAWSVESMHVADFNEFVVLA